MRLSAEKKRLRITALRLIKSHASSIYRSMENPRYVKGVEGQHDITSLKSKAYFANSMGLISNDEANYFIRFVVNSMFAGVRPKFMRYLKMFKGIGARWHL